MTKYFLRTVKFLKAINMIGPMIVWTVTDLFSNICTSSCQNIYTTNLERMSSQPVTHIIFLKAVDNSFSPKHLQLPNNLNTRFLLIATVLLITQREKRFSRFYLNLAKIF